MSVRINTGVSRSGGEWSCQRIFAKFYSALRRLLFTALPSPGMIILCKVVRTQWHTPGTKTSWSFVDSSSREASARADMWFVITEDNGQYWSGPSGAVMNTDPWADIKNATDDPAALLDRVDISGPPLNTKKIWGHCYKWLSWRNYFFKTRLSENKETALVVDFAQQTTIQTVFHWPRRIVSEVTYWWTVNSVKSIKWRVTWTLPRFEWWPCTWQPPPQREIHVISWI